jgi:hypothetical protein
MPHRAAGIALLAAAGLLSGADAPMRPVPVEELRDRIAGGWAGQMIGVSFGAPTEFRWLGQIIPREALPAWTPDRVRNALNQDDLYVDMTFAQVLDEKGLDATTEDFAAMFRQARYSLWHANLAARRALKRGVPPHLAGTPRYNAHANDIDFQIEADFIGLMAPGLPRASNDLCLRAGRVMNYGDGIYGGMFVSAMYAAAFFERDPRKVVEAGLAVLPRKSPYAQVIADVLAWSRQHPRDWQQVWERIQRKWDRRDPCPAGALRPFNIDAKLNGAYVALGLLYGGGDFAKTLEIATRAGQDSDCNPASAAGVLGVMLGYRRIPEEWKAGIEAIAEEKFQYTEYTFRSIVASTQRRAIALAERLGGRLEGDRLWVPLQSPEPAKLEIWDDYGSPVERIGVTDKRWTWAGGWQTLESSRRGHAVVSKTADSKGAEAVVSFSGTGAVLTGPYLPDGGKAEIYLDGKLDRVVDVYSDETAAKGGEAVWHAFGLKPGRHTVRIVVVGEPYPGSAGAKVTLEDLVVFR